MFAVAFRRPLQIEQRLVRVFGFRASTYQELQHLEIPDVERRLYWLPDCW
jgi:hypothetical protein